MCGDAVRESNIKLEGVDYIWAGKYVAMTTSKKEIKESNLNRIVPERKYKKGSRPGINSAETAGKKKETEEEELVTKWSPGKTELTDD